MVQRQSHEDLHLQSFCQGSRALPASLTIGMSDDKHATPEPA